MKTLKSQLLEMDMLIVEVLILLKGARLFKRRAANMKITAHNRATAIKRLLREASFSDRRILEASIKRREIASSPQSRKFWKKLLECPKAKPARKRGRPRKA